ncbi:MAG TPA: hypothetical protein VFN33_08380 [Gaiellaceae bacterium]|nr:hypothetical protein [Gaiellaceae bacterium]
MVLRHGAARPRRDAGVDAAEELMPLFLRQAEVVRERAEHGDVLVGGVRQLMQVLPLLDRCEEPGGAELVRPALDFPRTQRRSVVRVRDDGVVVLLHLLEERIAFLGGDVRAVDHRERPAGAEDLRRLRVAELGRDPVEGCKREDGVEARSLRLPRLELGDEQLRLGNVAPRDLRQLRRELDSRHRVAATHQLGRRLPGAGPDLEHA